MVTALLPASASAQRAIEDAPGHALVPQPPGSYITQQEFVDYAELAFPAAAMEGNDYRELLQVEGAHTRVEYSIDGMEVSNLRLYRSYLDYFEGQGFEVVFAGFEDELSNREGFTFLSRSFIARQPATRGGANGYILARSDEQEAVISLSFFSRQNARRILANVVELESMDLFDLSAPEPASPAEEEEVEEVSATCTCPEVAPTDDQEPQDAAMLESELVADGRVIVNAILFAFDSDEILPESAEALATVAELLDTHAELKLLVVGHSDSVGEFDYNLRLSLDRAAAVVAWLRERHGIAASRLRPAGAGPMSPVTTNRTEEGRTSNRRVELVELVEKAE